MTRDALYLQSDIRFSSLYALYVRPSSVIAQLWEWGKKRKGLLRFDVWQRSASRDESYGTTKTYTQLTKGKETSCPLFHCPMTVFPWQRTPMWWCECVEISPGPPWVLYWLFQRMYFNLNFEKMENRKKSALQLMMWTCSFLSFAWKD